MRLSNLRSAPRWITPDMVRRILELAIPVGGGPAPITQVATRGVKPSLAIVESKPAIPPSSTLKCWEVNNQLRKDKAAAQLEKDRPLFQIAFDRGIAVVDLAQALGRHPATALLHTKQAGFEFGRRLVLADPLTIEQLLALADPAIPLPELHCDRAKRERLERSARTRRDKRAADVARRKAERTAAADQRRRQADEAKAERLRKREAERARRLAAKPAPKLKVIREVEKAAVRQAAVSAPSREPALLPQARAHLLPARPVSRALGMAAYAERMRAAVELLRARHFVVRRYNPEEVIGRWQVTGQHGLLSNEELVELAIRHGLELAL